MVFSAPVADFARFDGPALFHLPLYRTLELRHSCQPFFRSHMFNSRYYNTICVHVHGDDTTPI